MFTGALPEKTHALLKKIFPSIGNQGFYLAGGTGLALQMGHRVSEDLDFLISQPFSTSSLATSLTAKVDRLEEILAEVQILIADLERVKCSFFYYEIPLIFEAISWQGMKIADWRDILAEKFKTLAQRGSKKDFYDIFCTLRSNKISLEETVSIFRKRFQSSGVNFYQVLRSLAYFEDADPEPDPRTLKGFDVS
jgi:predicted nucleotidyltransferase component of viral defense system